MINKENQTKVHLQHWKTSSASPSSSSSLSNVDSHCQGSEMKRLLSFLWCRVYPVTMSPFCPLTCISVNREDRSQKVYIYIDGVEEWRICTILAFISSSTFSLCTLNVASLFSLHQPVLKYILIYMVLCKRKPYFGPGYPHEANLLHLQEVLQSLSQAQLLHPLGVRYGDDFSKALEWICLCFWVRQP